MALDKALKSRLLVTPIEIGSLNNRKLFAVSVESPISGSERYGNSIYVSYSPSSLDTMSYDSLLKMTQVFSSELNGREIDKLRKMKV